MKKIICMFFVVMLVSTMAISGYSLDVGDNNPEIYVEYLSDYVKTTCRLYCMSKLQICKLFLSNNPHKHTLPQKHQKYMRP